MIDYLSVLKDCMDKGIVLLNSTCDAIDPISGKEENPHEERILLLARLWKGFDGNIRWMVRNLESGRESFLIESHLIGAMKRNLLKISNQLV